MHILFKANLTMKRLYKILLFTTSFLLFTFTINGQDKSDFKSFTYLLDNKPVTKEVIDEKIKKNEIEFVGGAMTSREAVLRFGEKFRTPIFIYKTIKKEDK